MSASPTIPADILEAPAVRSRNTIGTSVMVAPTCWARWVISIWNP